MDYTRKNRKCMQNKSGGGANNSEERDEELSRKDRGYVTPKVYSFNNIQKERPKQVFWRRD